MAGRNLDPTDAAKETPYVAIRLGALRNIWRSSPFRTNESAIDGFWGHELCAPPLSKTKDENSPPASYVGPTSPWARTKADSDQQQTLADFAEVEAPRSTVPIQGDLVQTDDGRLG